jgi:hypothetical protein
VQQAADNKQEQGSTIVIKRFREQTNKPRKEKIITLGYSFIKIKQ